MTHTMFCVGSLMSQVLQCTQFCALICSRGSVAVVVAHDFVHARRAVALLGRVIESQIHVTGTDGSLSVRWQGWSSL